MQICIANTSFITDVSKLIGIAVVTVSVVAQIQFGSSRGVWLNSALANYNPHVCVTLDLF